MSDIFFTSVNAVLPIVLLILLGYVLKRIKFLSESFVKIGNKFVFNVCLPCMLFVNVYNSMNSFADIRWDVVIYSVTVILIIFGLGLLTAVLTTKKNSRRGVILQCTFRSNFAIIGLSLVERIGGDGGIAGIVSAFSIPVFNILAVIALSVFAGKRETEEAGSGEQLSIELEKGEPQKKSLGKRVGGILFNIVKNPLIIGVAVGLLFVGIREIERACCGGSVPFRFDTQLKFLYVCTKDLKAIASPLALVVLGGQFEFSAVKGMTKEIIVGTLWRIILAPLIGIGVACLLSGCTDLFTFGPEIYPTLIALFATPVAVSSAIMAGQMGGDEQLATQLVVWTSVCSILTVFISVLILMSCGLIVA
ncbi:MAG: AEC family transporter [Clostridiales bacterium]|nr:AEC family transporter [Clostridiales bacterium]